ncbi:pyridoxal phosphate-dependent aminotransferase [Lacticaseibacillus saniviri]|uniref:Aminotransferase n=2 Tax=Lacticaseibacillus saniviri TaxID=931533 RepID=A0A0R2MNF6_9LACO|nr:pyridoxal phosphate-dependent aminotransferase [Lacticaseibacillus saniviri]KRO15246.1 aromatic amino acid aminotransferase [Lacticaseibacillus saniviri JCM 17471 = DSM 24301]
MTQDYSLNQQLNHIEVSEIRQFDEAVSGIPGILKLTLGEPDFNTPEHVKQAAIDAIENNYSHYTGMAGDPELRQAVADFIHTKYQVDYRPTDEILVTVGATEALATAITTITNPGDALLLPAPIYPGYLPLLHLNQVTPIYIDTRATDFVLTPELIEATITAHPEANIKGIILNYPSNPTGVTYRDHEVQALAQVIKNHHLIAISDEIYSELTYGESHVSLAKYAFDQTILVNGLSKSHAMTGWRIGFLMAPSTLTTEMKKVHQYLVTAATTVAQRAAIEALTTGIDDGQAMKAEYLKRRDFMFAGLQELGFSVARPDGAFYLFAKIPAELQLNSRDFTKALAEENQLAIIPGTAFGDAGEGYVRLSYAASMATLEDAMARLTTFMINHRAANQTA